MLKPLHRIYLLLCLIAFLLALIATLGIYLYTTPFQFTTKGGIQKQKKANTRDYFYDLNHNGLEEWIITGNNPEKEAYFLKVYKMPNWRIIDQFNFQTPIIEDALSYYDLNGDGVDEIFIFSNDDDALYLSVIDIARIKFLEREKPILASSPQRAQRKWDIQQIYPQFSDLDGDGRVEMIFNVHSGYSHLPRCLCVLDLQMLEIIKRFNHHMGYVKFQILDINHDGKKELALGSEATNNFPDQPDLYLSDRFSWALLLDYQLNPLIEPLQMGGKFTKVAVSVLTVKDRPLFLFITRAKNKTILHLMDSGGKIVKKHEYDFTETNYQIIHLKNNTPGIFFSSTDGRIFRINHQLKINNVLNTPGRARGSMPAVLNVLGDEKPEVIFTSIKGVYILDFDGDIQAFYPTKNDVGIYKLYPIHGPSSPPPHFVLSSAHSTIELRLIPNRLYGKLPLAFPGFFLTFFLLLFLGHLSLNKLHQYVSYFLFSLRGSDNAIILLNHKGRVLSVNEKVNQFLGLEEPVKRKQHFAESLKRRPMVVEAIEKCRLGGQQVQRQFSFEDAKKSFVGEITITPFRAFMGHISAYLVEIKDSTREVLMERQQNWQRNIRKLVHDIKTPLAGVQLKLQTLYMNIAEKHPEIGAEMLDSLEAAHQELLRIRNISKDFLKFSDLEKVQPRSLNPRQFIEQCLSPFKLYENEQLQLSLSLSPDLPEVVFWDERQIELLLHIIAENSLDALKGTGKIEVEVKPVSRSGHSDAAFVEIRISDNGPGIPSEHQGKVFEPHFSTKKEGSGLGLAFAKHIVQQHGGKIDFFSIPSSGTVFEVTLPVMVNTPTER